MRVPIISCQSNVIARDSTGTVRWWQCQEHGFDSQRITITCHGALQTHSGRVSWWRSSEKRSLVSLQVSLSSWRSEDPPAPLRTRRGLCAASAGYSPPFWPSPRSLRKIRSNDLRSCCPSEAVYFMFSLGVFQNKKLFLRLFRGYEEDVECIVIPLALNGQLGM